MNEQLDIILSNLESHVEDMPVGRIFDELFVVNERLNFGGITENPEVYGETQRQQITFLLDRDVSPGMLQFVLYLAKMHCLHYVMDDLSDVFITYCRSYFASRTQIAIITAVKVGEETRERVKELLGRVHPEPSRILFMTDRSLIAGLTIRVDEHQADDYSFKTQIVKLLDQHVRTKQQDYYANAQ